MHPLLRFTCVLAATLVAAAPVSAQESTSGDGVDLASIEAWSDAGAPDAPTADSPSAIFSYHHILGSALRPRSSSSTFAYGGNGCIYVTGGSEIRFQFPVTLPEGSEIRYVRIYYNDAATQDVTVWLTKYQPGQSSTDLVSVSSTGSGGYGTALSPLLSEIVDNSDNYTVVFAWGTTGSTQQICGVRINYWAP
jgi:hypothetical protein